MRGRHEKKLRLLSVRHLLAATASRLRARAVHPLQRMPARRALHVRLPGLYGPGAGRGKATATRGAIAELIEIVGGREQARLGMAEGAALFGCLIFGYFLACELH